MVKQIIELLKNYQQLINIEDEYLIRNIRELHEKNILITDELIKRDNFIKEIDTLLNKSED